MAKRQKIKAFSFEGFDDEHYRLTEKAAAYVDGSFSKATEAICYAVLFENYNADKPFSFDDYPKSKNIYQEFIENLASSIDRNIYNGSRDQWQYACQKNDDFIASIMATSKLKKAQLDKMRDRNLDSLKLFEERKVNGMNLSQRIWKYVEQYRTQIELGLDVCLGKGLNHKQLSMELIQNIQNPDQLCKLIREKRGNLQLSKVEKAFNIGHGVYRSSYKNIMRLVRSEINMAYRESEWLRWQQLDFVVGFEIKVSNRHEEWLKKVKFKGVEICDRLQGKYPKTFKFKGWHPQCLCLVVPILHDEEMLGKQESDLKGALYSAKYKKFTSNDAVTDVPQCFKDWVAENIERQANWKSTPYFVRDNFKDGLLSNGLKFGTFESRIAAMRLVDWDDESNYTKDRKDAALWAQTAKEGDEKVRGVLEDVWQSATKYEKLCVYRYTDESAYINNPLRGKRYKDPDFDIYDPKKDAAAVKNIINKSSYPFDMWVQRGINKDGFKGLFGFDLMKIDVKKLNSIYGKTGIEKAFSSCGVAKRTGFEYREIIYNIYCPRGTKILYAEPFAVCGCGAQSYNWEGKEKQKEFSEQAEMIIQCNTKFRIIKAEYDNEEEVYYIDLEVIGQDVE